MRRIAVCATLLVLAGCSGNTASSADDAAPCIDGYALLGHRDRVAAQLTKAENEMRVIRMNRIDNVATALQMSASEVRSMADETQETLPEAAKHFLLAADALDQAAPSLINVYTQSSISWLGQGLNEVNQGVNQVSADDYC